MSVDVAVPVASPANPASPFSPFSRFQEPLGCEPAAALTTWSVGGPPDEPPATVRAELLWRLAVRLHHDHELRRVTAAPPDGSADDPGRCRRCRQEWPCSGRRLAELGLAAASTRAGPG